MGSLAGWLTAAHTMPSAPGTSRPIAFDFFHALRFNRAVQAAMSRTQKLDLNKERDNRRAYRQTRRAEYEKRITRRNAQLEAIEKLEAAIDAGNSVADLETAIATAQVHVTPSYR